MHSTELTVLEHIIIVCCTHTFLIKWKRPPISQISEAEGRKLLLNFSQSGLDLPLKGHQVKGQILFEDGRRAQDARKHGGRESAGHDVLTWNDRKGRSCDVNSSFKIRLIWRFCGFWKTIIRKMLKKSLKIKGSFWFLKNATLKSLRKQIAKVGINFLSNTL